MEALALYGYHARKEDELSLSPGDVVQQVRPGPARGWLQGMLRGRCGLFPERLVQEIPEDLRGDAGAHRPRCPRRRGHPAKSRGLQRWCKVNFNYSPEQADELELQAGEIVEMLQEIEDGWWLGQKNGQLGAFPSNFVELLDTGPPSCGYPDMPPTSPYPHRPSKLSSLTSDSPPDYLQTVSHPEIYRVLFDYKPEAPDELELHSGDQVKVLRKATQDKGWWEGECGGRRGVFPDNFVLPPPPIKKLVPRKTASQESAPPVVKEPKKKPPKTALPAVKKVTASTGPSKAKPCKTPIGNSQKDPSCDAGSSGRFLRGAPGHPGRKRAKAQVPQQQRSEPSQVQERSSLAKAPSGNKTPTLDKNPKPEKTLYPDKATAPEKPQTVAKVPTPEAIPTPEKGPAAEGALTPDRASVLEETPTLDVGPVPEKILSPDRAASPEKTRALDKTPTPEKTSTLGQPSTPEKTLTPDTVPNPEGVSAEDEVPGPKDLPEGEAPGPQIACPEDEAPTVDKTANQDGVLCEEPPYTLLTNRLHHFSPEKPLQQAQCHVAKEAPASEEGLVAEEPPLQPCSPESVCGEMKPHFGQKDSSPVQPGSTPVPAPTKKEASTLTLQEVPRSAGQATHKEETAGKEETPHQTGASPQEEVPPSEVDTAPKKPQTMQPIPDPQETPALQPLAPLNPTEDKDGGDLATLQEEVASLRRLLELMGTQLESQLRDIRQELKREREQRWWLEAQVMQRTPAPRSPASIH